jgi:hypothetical protein
VLAPPEPACDAVEPAVDDAPAALVCPAVPALELEFEVESLLQAWVALRPINAAKPNKDRALDMVGR